MPVFFKIVVIVTLMLTSSSWTYACDEGLRIVRVGTEGLDDQIAKRVLEKAGCEIKLVQFERMVPLDRRMALLAYGQIDMIIAVNKRPDRELIGNFSIAFEEERIRLWSKKENLQKLTGLSLQQLIKQGYTIVGPSSGWYGSEYQLLKEEGHLQLVLYTDIPHGLRLLHRDRGDIFLGSEHFQEYFVEPFNENTLILPQVVHTDSYHFMFSKQTVSAQTIEKINNAIRDVQSESSASEVKN